MSNLLSASGLRAGYGPAQVLHDVSVEVEDGETVAVLGVNGAGKSTLLRCLMGMHPLNGGSVSYRGADITRQPAHWRIRSGLVMVAEGRELFPTLSVEENLRAGFVALGKKVRGAAVEELLQRATELFPALRDRRSQLAGTLSGGEQQMLAIARALAAEPRLLLLDEPSLGLSPVIVDLIYDRLAVMKRGGLAMVLVEQHVGRALEVADRGYVLDLGRVAAKGTVAELTAAGEVRQVYFGQNG